MPTLRNSRRSLKRPDGADPLALRVLYCPDDKARGEYKLADKAFTVGRKVSADEGAPADWCFADARISRQHARIERHGSQVRLTDLHSTNGTAVNGENADERELASDDVIRLGDTLFTLAPIAKTAASKTAAHKNAIAVSAGAERAFAKAQKAARSPIPVMILGDSGTGKEVLARYLHDESGRAGKLVAVNCAALPEDLIESTMFGHVKGAFTGAQSDSPGLFGEARDGTLFLDEIGEMPLALQAKLLRAVESGEYIPVGGRQTERSNARIISATNVDLREAMRDGRFRSDLYARLFGELIVLLPLAERRADILPLFDRFCTQHPGYTADFAERLLCHDWPLNVRELRVVVQRLELSGSREMPWDVDDLEGVLATHAESDDIQQKRRSAPSKEELTKLLEDAHGNVEQVAAKLSSHRAQIYRWLKRHDLDPDAFRS